MVTMVGHEAYIQHIHILVKTAIIIIIACIIGSIGKVRNCSTVILKFRRHSLPLPSSILPTHLSSSPVPIPPLFLEAEVRGIITGNVLFHFISFISFSITDFVNR